MYMSGNTGPGGFSQVHAQIQTVWVVEFTQNSLQLCVISIISWAAFDESFWSWSWCSYGTTITWPDV